jgi:hypothetical protein
VSYARTRKPQTISKLIESEATIILGTGTLRDLKSDFLPLLSHASDLS